MQRIDEFYQSWGAAAGDFNKDGVLDVVAGPSYYLGPAYTTRGEIDISPAQAPSTSFARTMIDYAYDFTGDGWTDVLAGESRPMHLYVNPKGENHRWAKYPVLPQITSEVALMRDIDGDGKPEIVFGRAASAAPWPSDGPTRRIRLRRGRRIRFRRLVRRTVMASVPAMSMATDGLTSFRPPDGGSSPPQARVQVCGRITRTLSADGDAPKGPADPRWWCST